MLNGPDGPAGDGEMGVERILVAGLKLAALVTAFVLVMLGLPGQV